MGATDQQVEPGNGPAELTRLLRAWQAGDAQAGERLFERVYPQLRRIAARHVRQRLDETIEPTEVVHEAYLKLEKAGRLDWPNRVAFFGLAARAVRQVLVDRLRSRCAVKRGGDQIRAALDVDRLPGISHGTIDLLDLDQALTTLANHDAQAARIVELRFFGGLTIPECAQLLEVGTATVSRRWQLSRAWLRRALTEAGSDLGDYRVEGS